MISSFAGNVFLHFVLGLLFFIYSIHSYSFSVFGDWTTIRKLIESHCQFAFASNVLYGRISNSASWSADLVED